MLASAKPPVARRVLRLGNELSAARAVKGGEGAGAAGGGASRPSTAPHSPQLRELARPASASHLRPMNGLEERRAPVIAARGVRVLNVDY